MRRAGTSEQLKKCVDVYIYLSYQLLLSFGWIIYHGVEGGKFNVVDGTD